MDQGTGDAAAIEAEIARLRDLGIEALRKRWRLISAAIPPKGLTKGAVGLLHALVRVLLDPVTPGFHIARGRAWAAS